MAALVPENQGSKDLAQEEPTKLPKEVAAAHNYGLGDCFIEPIFELENAGGCHASKDYGPGGRLAPG